MKPLKEFLDSFTAKVAQKSKQLNLASWLLETTGSEDAAQLKAELEIELRLLFNNRVDFEKLVAWEKEPDLHDPLLKRQVNVLIRAFKPNMIPSELIKKTAQAEAQLALLYSNFRPELEGKSQTENALKEILKNEDDVAKRIAAWEASKQIGKVMAPHLLKLVALRNEAARHLGYSNYFSMQLELQEVDEEWLMATLNSLAEKSDAAYSQLIEEIKVQAAKRFHVSPEEIGPWAWSEPFCQEDPLDVKELDQLVSEVEILEASEQFYNQMGLEVEAILKRSDNFERPGKNQHAFCTHIDRVGDVRTLNNIQPTVKWLETVLHELGHAVYELGFSKDLPWLLREPPHMITTEAMALLAGRQAYRAASLKHLASKAPHALGEKAETSLKRRQLIFSRWVLVMTHFERELYRNPHQDLNSLWWSLVEKFQKISSQGSHHQCDWAAKYHMSLAPVYYFSYLLGELFASSLETRLSSFASRETGNFLQEKVFQPGNRLSWNDLIQHATGKPLTDAAWLKQFT